MKNFIETLQEQVEGTGAGILLLLRALSAIFSQRKLDLILTQMMRIGVTSLPVVAIAGFSTGMVLAAQSFFQLADKGLTEATGIMVAKAMLTEIGPFLTAFMITGRVGASICAELGTMRVSEQISALRSLEIDPVYFLVTPRVQAGILAIPLLTLFNNAMGILGSFLISTRVFNMSPATFLNPIPIYLSRFDLFTGLAKSVVFALIIIGVSCYKGLNTRGGAEGVGKSTTESVVISYAIILISNFLLTLGLNLATHWF